MSRIQNAIAFFFFLSTRFASLLTRVFRSFSSDFSHQTRVLRSQQAIRRQEDMAAITAVLSSHHFEATVSRQARAQA